MARPSPRSTTCGGASTSAAIVVKAPQLPPPQHRPPRVSRPPARYLAADEQVALHLLDLMVSERWKDVAPYFDHRMKRAVPSSKLASTWAQITSDFGAYQNHGQASGQPSDAYEVIEMPLTFEHGTATMRTTFAPSGLVAGLYILQRRDRVACGQGATKGLPLSRSTINQLELGKRGISVDDLVTIGEALGVPPHVLLYPSPT
jgi:hypothetical protein